MPYPVKTVTLPSELIGKENGRLNSNDLVSVGPSGLLLRPAARAWAALCSDARNNGYLLTYTYGGTYRDFPSQKWLRESRYSVDGTFGGCKTCNGIRYCLKGNFAGKEH